MREWIEWMWEKGENILRKHTCAINTLHSVCALLDNCILWQKDNKWTNTCLEGNKNIITSGRTRVILITNWGNGVAWRCYVVVFHWIVLTLLDDDKRAPIRINELLRSRQLAWVQCKFLINSVLWEILLSLPELVVGSNLTNEAMIRTTYSVCNLSFIPQ